MIPALFSFLLSVPAQSAVIVYTDEELLTRENTCHEFQIFHGKRDVTHDSTLVAEERKSIFDAMAIFFPDPCHYYSKRRQQREGVRKLYEVNVKFYLSADGKRIRKMQMTVIRAKGHRNLLSLIYKIKADPPKPAYVVIKQEIIKAHIEFLQKLPQSKPCP